MERQEAQEVDESRRHNVEHKKTNTKEYTLCDSIWFRNRQQYSMAVDITTAYLPGDWRLLGRWLYVVSSSGQWLWGYAHFVQIHPVIQFPGCVVHLNFKN